MGDAQFAEDGMKDNLGIRFILIRDRIIGVPGMMVQVLYNLLIIAFIVNAMWFEIGILVDVENMVFKIVYVNPNEEVVNHPYLKNESFTIARQFGLDGHPVEEYE